MENDLKNNGVSESSPETKSIITYERMMTIINLMFVKKHGATFLKNCESIKSFPLLKAEEKEFVDEIYNKIKELDIGEDVTQITNVQQLKDELYAMCHIPSEFIESVNQKNEERKRATLDKIASDKKIWAEQDAEDQKRYAKIEDGQPVKVPSNIKRMENEYKEGLYQPALLCGHSVEIPGKPYVKHVGFTPEKIANTSINASYQFADRSYIIKKVGNLIYMSTPNLQDGISEYEITISRDDQAKTIRVFGEISLSKMSDPYYQSAVFLQLLGVSNLTDRELKGYIGSLEQVRDEAGNLKNEYKIVHAPEEYTAVATWEQIEKARKEKKAKNPSKSLKDSEEEKETDER